jgi:hypothetical protein
MHCDRRDILRWRRAKKLKKQSENAYSGKPKSKIKAKKISPQDKSFIRVIKKDGTVIIIEKKLSL